MAQQKNLADRNQSFISNMMIAAKTSDLQAFTQCCSNLSRQSQKKDNPFESLFLYSDEDGNTIFHHLLVKNSSWFSSRKKRRNKAIMCDLLLRLNPPSHCFNVKNRAGQTALHLAIIGGKEDVVEKMINLKADIEITSTTAETSTLELAATHKHYDIYKKLLKIHSSLNKKSSQPRGFTHRQIERAEESYISHLRGKQIKLGIFGSILTIACPVGAIFAFYELPLLEIIFTALIPGLVGPIIGIAGAILIGGLLYWSMYSKADMKHGSHAQKKIILNNKIAILDRLEAELRSVERELDNNPGQGRLAVLRQEQQRIKGQLDSIYAGIKPEVYNVEAEYSDWATSSDHLRAKALTLGAFLCSFSGILGISGGIATYLPAVALTTTVLAGVPVAGWIALGFAIGVGAAVATWAYYAKYKPTLEACGKARKAIYQIEVELAQRKRSYLVGENTNTSNPWLKTVLGTREEVDTNLSDKPPSSRNYLNFNPTPSYSRLVDDFGVLKRSELSRAGETTDMRLPPPTVNFKGK